ncbi:Fic family protein [Hydrogenophaga sp.]|uniref:Fic family protein n=1 Tax=Hydrogenophaga sp. TaxID=1904254 RepID=UPI00198AB7D3|nr:RNA-binding domain-containing protein [Hydrogenophaga sp.]MBD3892670.1 hypothetical protein [Hydrogenophaga sp.]
MKPQALPINIADLLRQRTVEGERIEYKAGWNPDAIIRTLCAFANDFQNLGGGYVVIGQDCDAKGQPVFPPVGLQDKQLDKIQRELLSLTAQVPWDDRFAQQASVVDLSRPLMLDYLREVGSALADDADSLPLEALVNAVYHRSYEEREPVEVRIGYDELVIVSVPGPDRSIKTETDDDRLACAVHLPAHPQAWRPEPGGADTGTMDVTMDVTPEVSGLLKRVQGEMSRAELQAVMGLRNADHFRKAYLAPAMAVGALEMTDPTSPRSTRQRYRLTTKGRPWLQQQAQEGHR